MRERASPEAGVYVDTMTISATYTPPPESISA